jgi:hypothetical protein
MDLDGQLIATLLTSIRAGSRAERSAAISAAQDHLRARWIFRTVEMVDALFPLLASSLAPKRVLALPCTKVSDGDERNPPENYWHMLTLEVRFLEEPLPVLHSASDSAFFDEATLWVIIPLGARLQNLGRFDLQVKCGLPAVKDPLTGKNLLSNFQLFLGLEQVSFGG